MGSSRTYLILLLCLTFSGPAIAQEFTPNERATRYHRILQKKPDNATLFNRFVESWLDTDSKESLQIWLEQSTKDGTPADFQILAAFHDYLGQDQAALRALNQAVKAAPTSPGLKLNRAKLHARLLDFEAALRDLATLTADPKLGSQAAKLQGIYLARAGRIPEALASWKALATKLPKDEELREDLIEIQVVEGLFKEAAASARDLVAMTRDPYKKALRQLRLGDLLILANDRQAGLETYQSIVANTAADTWLEREVLAQIERIFLRDDDIKGLRAFYQKLNEAHPRRVSIRKALARQMAANQEIDEAIALFREVLKITPGDLSNREEFITFLESSKKLKLARTELTELLKQNPTDPSLWEHLLRLESSLANPDGIKAALLEIKKLRGQSPEGLIAIASLYQQADLLPETQKILREAKSTFPDSAEITEALASHLITNNAEPEALALWQKMADGAPRDVLLRVARSLSSHGKRSEAFQLLLSRQSDFQKDPLFLTQTSQLASTEKESLQAIPLGQQLIALSTKPTDLENAVRLTRQLILRAKKTNDTLATPPTTIGQKCLHASLIAQLGDLPRAVRLLQEAGKSDPTQLAQFFHIRFEEEFGNTQSAIALLRQIIATPDGRKTVHYRRLVALLETSGDYPAALAAVDEWKKIAPGDQSAWLRRADLLIANDQPAKATTQLRRLIGKFGADEQNRARLAEALLDDGELRPARQIYQRLYEEADDLPGKLKWIASLAQIAEQDGSTAELLADFDRRKRANPTSVAPLLAIAEIHREQGNYEQRRSALLEASRRRPKDLQLLLNIASEEERHGEFARAISILSEAQKRDPGTTITRRLANLHLRLGEIQTGLRILSEIPGENDDPRNIEATTIALLAGRELAAATTHLEGHLRQHRDDWRLRYLHGILLDLNQEFLKSAQTFTSLLTTQKEIPNLPTVLGPKGSNPVINWQKPLKGTPPDWLELDHLYNLLRTEHYDLLRTLRGQQSRSSFSNIITLPGTPREARVMSALRTTLALDSIAGHTDEKEALLGSLTLPEFPSFQLFKQLNLTEETDRKTIDQALAKNPNSHFHLTLWLNHATGQLSDPFGDYSMPIESTPEEREKIFQKLSKEAPILAAENLLTALSSGTLPEEEVAPLSELILASTPPALLPDVFLNYTDLRDTLDSYSRQTLTAVSSQLYTHSFRLKQTPQDLSWLTEPLTYVISEQKTDEAIQLLNLIGRRPTEKQSTSAQLPTFGQGYQSGSSEILTPPPFPQFSHSRLPYILNKKLLEQFTYQDNPTAQKRAKLLAKLSPKHAKKTSTGPLAFLRGHEAKIEHPFLRQLITAALSPKIALPKIAAEFATSTDPNKLFFAAGYFFKEGQITKSNSILLRLHLLPLSREIRTQVDGHLAHLGAILVSRKAPDFDPNPATKAALRLRRLMFGEEREFLAGHLTALGRKTEALRITQANPNPNHSRSRRRSQARPSSSRSTRSGRDGVLHYIFENKPDAAIREATKTIIGEQRSSSRSNLLRSIGYLRSLHISDQVLAKLTPPATASRARRFQHAKLADQMGNRKAALEAYRSLLAQFPDDPELQAWSLSITPLEQWPTTPIKPDTLAILSTLPKNDLPLILKVTQLITDLVEKTSPETKEPNSLDWTVKFFKRWQNQTDFGLIQIIGFYGRSPSNNHNDLEAEKLRNAAFLRLLHAMLRHPDLAPAAFEILSLSQDHQKIPDQQLHTLARSAFLDLTKIKPDPENSFAPPSLLTEDDAIGNHLLTHRDTDFLYLDSTLLALRQNFPADAASLTLLRALSQQPADQTLITYRSWEAKLSKDPDQATDQIKKLTFLLARLQPPHRSWAPLLQRHLLALAKLSPDPNSPAVFGNWARYLGLTNGPSTMLAYLIPLFETHLGPQQNWPLYYEIGYRYLPKELKVQLSFCSSVAGYIAYRYEPSVVLPLTLLIADSQLALPLEQADNILSTNGFHRDTIFTSINGSDPEIADKLALSGFLKDDNPDTLTQRGLLLMRNEIYADDSATLRKLIEAQPGNHPALQAIFIITQLNPDQASTQLAKLITDFPDLIKSCRLKDRQMVEYFLNLHHDPDTHQDNATAQLLAEIQHEHFAASLKNITPWLLDGLPLQHPSSLGHKIWRALSPISKQEPLLAAHLVEQTFLQLEKWPKAQEATISTGTQSPIFDEWQANFYETFFSDNTFENLPKKIIVLDQLLRSEAMNFLHPRINNHSNDPFHNLSIGGRAINFPDLLQNLSKDPLTNLPPPQQLTLFFWSLKSGFFPTLPDSQNSLTFTDTIQTQLRNLSPIYTHGLSYLYLAKGYRKLDPKDQDLARPRLNQARQALLTTLNQHNYPLATRLSFLASLLQIAPIPSDFFADPDFANQTLQELVTYQTTHRQPSNELILQLINGLAQIDPATHPTWATNLIATCQKNFSLTDFSFYSNATLQAILIPPALAAGKQDLVRQWLTPDLPNQRGNTCLMLDLASAGLDDLVKELIHDNPTNYRPPHTHLFRKDWPSKLPHLLSLVPEDHRFPITLALTSCRDATGPLTPAIDRQTRLDALAKTALQNLPKDRSERLGILVLLSKSLTGARILQAPLRAEVASLDLEMVALAEQESNTSAHSESFYHIISQLNLVDLADGQTARPLAHFRSLAASRRYRSSGSPGFARNLITKSFPSIIQRASRSPADAQKMATFSRQLFDLTFQFEDRDSSLLNASLALIAATHALADNFPVWEKHLAQQSPEIQAWANSHLSPGENNFAFFSIFTMPPKQQETHLQLLTALLSSEWIKKTLWPDLDRFDLTTSFHNFATRAQILQAAQQLPETNPLKSSYLKSLEKDPTSK